MSESNDTGFSSKARTVAVPVTVAAIIALLVGLGLSRLVWNQKDSPASAESECSATDVAATVMKSVVTIAVADKNGKAQGTGAGEFITSDGHILTNNHVVSPAANSGTITVQSVSRQRAEAELIGRDPHTDIAVLKVDETTSHPITFADPPDVEVGQRVFAVGAPLGLSDSMTAGIISGVNRTVRVPSDNDTTALLVAAIQTDASINPGNSGGTLADCHGHLVGVPTAGATAPDSTGAPVAGSIGLGFAIPAEAAKTIAKELIEDGRVTHGYLGAGVVPVQSEDGTALGLYINVLTPDGPAASAGLRKGDAITKADDAEVHNADQLQAVTLTKRPGEQVTLTYIREGKPTTADVTLGKLG